MMKRLILLAMAGIITLITMAQAAGHRFPATDIYPGLAPVYILTV